MIEVMVKLSYLESFQRMLHHQTPPDGERKIEWDVERRKKVRNDKVIEESVVRFREHKVGFVFDTETGTLKSVHTW